MGRGVGGGKHQEDLGGRGSRVEGRWAQGHLGKAPVGVCHTYEKPPCPSPIQVGPQGSVDTHPPTPPQPPQHTRGLTHRSRPHCSGQTPCTSLEITEQTPALALRQGPHDSPVTPACVLRKPTPPSPWGSFDTGPVISAIASSHSRPSPKGSDPLPRAAASSQVPTSTGWLCLNRLRSD